MSVPNSTPLAITRSAPVRLSSMAMAPVGPDRSWNQVRRIRVASSFHCLLTVMVILSPPPPVHSVSLAGQP